MFIMLFLINISLNYSLLPDDVKNNNKGIKSFKNNDYEKALEYFEAVDKFDIKNFNKGTSFYKKENYDDALSSFSKSLATGNNKTKLNSLYNMGNTLFKQNKIAEALRSYQEALDLCSNNHNELDQAYCKEMTDKIQNNMEYVFRAKEENKNQQDKKEDNDKKDKEDDKNQDKDKSKEDKNTDDDNNMSQDTSQNMQEEKENNISKDQARQLLNIINNNDKQIQEKLLKTREEKSSARGLKNW